MKLRTIVVFATVVGLVTTPHNAQGHIIDPQEHATKATGDTVPISEAAAGMPSQRIRGFSDREQIVDLVVSPRRATRNINHEQHRHHRSVIQTSTPTIGHLWQRVLQYGSTSTESQFKQKLVHFRTHLEYEYQKLPSELGLFLLITSFVFFLACVCCCFTAPFFLCYEHLVMYQIDRSLDMETDEYPGIPVCDIKVDTDEDTTSTLHDDGETLSAGTEC